MIEIEKLPITVPDSYDRLLDLIPSSHIDEEVVKFLKDNVGTRCSLLEVENPYFESDYLSCYYIFYAKKLQSFPKHCYRLLFYVGEKNRELIGYITLRPTYDGRHISRMFFDPQFVARPGSRLILGNCKCHVAGGEASLPVFPHMRQEGDVAVCAHVVTWSILRSFALRFHQYPELSLGKVVEKITPQFERATPSKGLSADQISRLFLDAGFAPIVVCRSTQANHDMKNAIVSYIESGIPLVAVLSNREHAVAVVGVGPRYQSEKRIDIGELIKNSPEAYEKLLVNGMEVRTNVVLASRFVDTIIVNDDSFFPYQPVSSGPRAFQVPYNLMEIDRLIVPLYPRIQLDYSTVRLLTLRAMEADKARWPSTAVTRIFLASANTLREHINQNCGALSPRSRTVFVILPMPKFVWCVEVGSPEHYQAGYIDGMILFDSTSATVNPSPELLIYDSTGNLRYKDDDTLWELEEAPMGELCIPSFSSNLKEVV